VHWQLSGPFAEQQVELLLRNPSGRAVEGTVLLPLAPHERLKGYALDVEGEWRQAVPIERTQARVAFESTVRQRLDPALLEHDGGNRYRLRVFPIPAKGERRVRFTLASLAERDRCGWQHRIRSDVVPMGQQVIGTLTSDTAPRPSPGGLAWLVDAPQKSWRAQLGLRAEVGGTRVCLPAPIEPVAFSHRAADGTSMLWMEVPGRERTVPTPRPLPTRLEVVWDASFLTPRDRSAELAVLDRYFQGATVQVTLTVLRQGVEHHSFQVNGGDWRALASHLQGLRPLGAAHLQAWTPAAEAEQVLYFGNASSQWPGGKDLPRPDKPVHVLASGVQDMAKAQWLTQAGGQVIDLAQRGPDAVVADLREVAPLRLAGGWRQLLWHAGSRTPERGSLRACHIAPPGHSAEPPVLTLARRGLTQDVVAPAALPHTMAAFWCATWWTQTLEAEPERHRGRLAELGQQYGVANRETSLLVLEQAQDYVRHGILPPMADPVLRDAVLLARSRQDQARVEAAARTRAEVRALWEARRRWWATDFPKTLPPRQPEAEKIALRRDQQERASSREARPVMAAPPPPAPMAAPPAMAAPAPAGAAPTAPGVALGMSLRAISMSEPYTGELQASEDAERVMQAYDRLVASYGNSPAFHFDVAERLFALGAQSLAVQVLSNLVALMPSEHAALRLVAYRLQQADAQAQALDLLKRIRELAPDEPQSFRDLALALAQRGDCDQAADLLLHVVQSPWSSRFAEIGLVALAEANALAVQCGSGVLQRLPSEWQAPLPIDLRVVLRWDLNDTDIDLHVTDPLGETVYFGRRLSRQGGAMSRDFTGGYGPEEFVLRKPAPGVYTVKVNYYGSRVAKLARGAGVSIQLQSGFATSDVKTQTLTMRLAERSGLIEVGRFEVLPQGGLAP